MPYKEVEDPLASIWIERLEFIRWQITQIRAGGMPVASRKARRFIGHCIVAMYRWGLTLLALPVALAIRLISPWRFIRFGELLSSRIGHYAANTELYLCEWDAGINRSNKTTLDLFFRQEVPYYFRERICNRQLDRMWRRTIKIWPTWALAPVSRAIRLMPGGKVHILGQNTNHDRDVHNLFDRISPHLTFTEKEEKLGEEGLRAMGIPAGSRFVCLLVRDSAYLDSLVETDWSYHSYRDSNIDNYVLAAEDLAEQGYYVIRMGAKVHRPFPVKHPRIIDYATNGMRSEFMDVYLGANCFFCISTSAGWDAIPYIFRRPIAYVNMVPLGYMFTFSSKFLGITRHHVWQSSGRELTLSEIFSSGAGFATQTEAFSSLGISLIENSPEEIRDLTIEMVERLEGRWQPKAGDEALQQRFWRLFPVDAKDKRGRLLHGEIRSKYGTVFLRNNRTWLL